MAAGPCLAISCSNKRTSSCPHFQGLSADVSFLTARRPIGVLPDSWTCVGMRDARVRRTARFAGIREPVPAPTDAASSWPRCPVSPLENPATAGTEDCPPALPRLTSVVSNTLEEACRAGGTPGFTSRQPRPALGDPSLCPLSMTRHQGFSPPGSA